MAEHVGPFRRASIESWLLDLEEFANDQIAALEELATRADGNQFADAAKHYRDAIALRRDSLKKLKDHYLA